jgi:hypothetical protein
VKFEVKADASRHPTPKPESGKALIYVVQEGGSSRFGVDGKWVGAIRGRIYFFVPIDPGEHDLWAIGPRGLLTRVSLHQLKAEVGTTFYFVPYFVASFDTDFNLSKVDPDEGKALVARSKFSTSHQN